MWLRGVACPGDSKAIMIAAGQFVWDLIGVVLFSMKVVFLSFMSCGFAVNVCFKILSPKGLFIP